MSEASDSPTIFSVEDILAFDLEPILSKPANPGLQRLKNRTCYTYEHNFAEEAKQSRANAEVKREQICEFFATICSFQLTLDLREPYRRAWTITEYVTPLPTELNQFAIDILNGIVEHITDAELQARIADVLWVVKKSGKRIPEIAKLAIQAYLKSADNLKHPEHFTESVERITRAFQIAKQLGKTGEEPFQTTVTYVESLISELNGEDVGFFSYRLMSLLIQYDLGEPARYIPLAIKQANNAEINHNWDKARAYWELSISWYEKAGMSQEANETKLKAAMTYVKKANDLVKQEKPALRTARHELQSAIEALRRISAPKELIEPIHAQMLKYQKEDDEFTDASFTVDIADRIKYAKDRVAEKPLRDAILSLALLFPIPKKATMERIVRDLVKASPFVFWITALQLDGQGRVTATRPSMFSDFANTSNLEEQALIAEMHRYMGYEHEFLAQAFIIPALQQINLEHSIRLSDLSEIVRNNPFIPPDYEHIFLRGLYYGLIGDFMLSTHLLIPQIENSIRYMLENREHITSKLDPQGIQDVLDLGKLLFQPELEEIFYDDIIFSLQGLLVSRFGTNLRNDVAHGKLPAYGFNNLRCVFFWWMVLYLCCVPILKAEQATEEELGSEDIDNGQQPR